MTKKITNIRYLDQRGLKTFHDATGWVEISIKHNDTFMVYDNSPIKFVNGGEVLIDGTKETIEIGKSYMYNVGTEIVNKRGSDLILNIFVKHYNQLIQNELKTNKLRLPGTTSQVVLGDGSLKGLDNLVVGNATNATKSNQLYISKITPSIPPGVQQSKTYNFFLSGFTDNSAGYKNLKGFDNVYVRVTESNGNIYENELVVPGISIPNGGINIVDETGEHGNLEDNVLQGDGQLIAKTDLAVGRAEQVKISNIKTPTDLVGLTYPLLGSLDGGSLDDPYNSLVNLNDYVFYSIIKDPSSNAISKTLIVADGEDENNIPLRGTIYGNLDGVAANTDAIKTCVYTKNSTPPDITYPILVKNGDNNLNRDEYITPVSSRDVYLKRVGDEYAILYAQRIKISKDPASGSNDYVDVASKEWVNTRISSIVDIKGIVENVFNQYDSSNSSK